MPNTTTTTTPRAAVDAAVDAAPVAGVRIQRFAGALNGWRDASPAVVDAATAARRLRLYRAVRGDAYVFRVSGTVLPVLPARRNATPWHARTVPLAAVYALFAVTYAAGAVLTAHTVAAPSTNAQTVRVALR